MSNQNSDFRNFALLGSVFTAAGVYLRSRMKQETPDPTDEQILDVGLLEVEALYGSLIRILQSNIQDAPTTLSISGRISVFRVELGTAIFYSVHAQTGSQVLALPDDPDQLRALGITPLFVPPIPVVASFTVSQSPTDPNLFTFTNTSTGGYDSISWDLGDGSTSTSETVVNKRYNFPGTYVITLDVSGPGGEDSAEDTATVPTPTPAPVARFSSSADPENPLSISFTNESTGDISGYSWDFGDNTGSTAVSPTRQYADYGVYIVRLTVSGPGGIDIVSFTINLPRPIAPPVASFQYSISSTDGFSVAFTNESTGGISSYSWDFGDNTGSGAVHPSHTYTSPGSYTVILTVSGPGGVDTDSDTVNISVPLATLNITSTPTGAIVSGDIVGVTPLVTQIPAGDYDITLSKSGYQSTPLSISISPGELQQHDISLIPVVTAYHTPSWKPVTISTPPISSGSANPVTDVIDFTYTHLDTGVQRKLPGYYAGDGVYSSNFSGPELGEWGYVTSSTISSLSNHSGTVIIDPSTSMGALAANTINPNKWGYTDGGPVVPIAIRLELFSEPDPGTNPNAVSDLADWMRDSGLHMVETRLLEETGQYGGRHDWIFIGDWREHKVDTAVFDRFVERLQILSDRDIGCHIMLYSDDAGRPGWGGQSTTEAIVIRCLVARVAAFPNIWFNTGIDIAEYRTPADIDWIGILFRALDPYNHPVSSRRGGGSGMHQMSQRSFDSEGNQNSNFAALSSLYGSNNLPVSMDDAWGENRPSRPEKNFTPDDIRRAAWKCVVAGGLGMLIRGSDGYFHLDTFAQDLESEQWLSYIEPFVASIPYASMEPVDIANTPAIADAGLENIVAYKIGEGDSWDAGGLTGAIELTLPNGTYHVELMNPSTGQISDFGNVVIDDSAPPPTGNTFLLQGEDGTHVIAGWQTGTDSRALGGQYIYYPSGSPVSAPSVEVQWWIDIQTPGTYYPWVRAFAASQNNREFEMSLQPGFRRVTVPVLLQWVWIPLEPRVRPVGVIDVRLGHISIGPRVDAIYITDDPNDNPNDRTF